MRKLILHRKRALACFGIPYYCLIAPDLRQGELPSTGFPVKNGETIRIEIPEEAMQFLVAIPTESKAHFTQVLDIPAGTQDVEHTVITYYNGLKILEFYLE